MIAYKEANRLLDYNSKTGIFRWKVNIGQKIRIGIIAGGKDAKGYIKIGIRNKAYKAHRLAWLLYYGYLPENDLDHINRIKHDNRLSNLREVSRSCNNRNILNPKNNTSKVKGVSWHKGKNRWLAHIGLNNKLKGLGHFKDFCEAVCHRLAAEQCLNWENCNSNSPAYQYVIKHVLKKEE